MTVNEAVGFFVVLALVLVVALPFIIRSYRNSTPGEREAARAERDRVLADQQWDNSFPDNSSSND